MVLLSAAPQHFMYHDDVVDIADRLRSPGKEKNHNSTAIKRWIDLRSGIWQVF